MNKDINYLDKRTKYTSIDLEEDAIFDEGSNIAESYINYIKKTEKYIKLAEEKYNMDIDGIIKYIKETLNCDIFRTNTEDILISIEALKGTIDYISINEQISILGENLNAVVLEEKDHEADKVNKYFIRHNDVM